MSDKALELPDVGFTLDEKGNYVLSGNCKITIHAGGAERTAEITLPGGGVISLDASEIGIAEGERKKFQMFIL